MATGKELVRMMTCDIWSKYVQNRPDYCSATIFDKNGKVISYAEAQDEFFCHVRILFRITDHTLSSDMDILAELLKITASTRSETMCSIVNNIYGFKEIIIC